MSDRELDERLRSIFVEELETYVRSLSGGFLALEKERDPELIKALFRDAHSLKGAARAVGAEPLARAAHTLEDVLALIRDDKRALDAAMFHALLLSSDAFEEAAHRFRDGTEVESSIFVACVRELAAIRDHGRAPSAAKEAVLTPASRTSNDAPRIAVNRLDALLRSGDELLIARARLASFQEDNERRRELAERWSRSWKRSESKLRRALLEAGPGLLRAIDEVSENLPRLTQELDRFASDFARDQRKLSSIAGGLEEEIRRLRMVRFAEVHEPLQRALRDAAQHAGCEAELILEDRGLELDRAVLDRLRDALAHLVRNAVAHGIERPEARRAAGKAPRGTVRVEATLRGTNVELVVEDDGRGVDLAAVERAARSGGLNVPATAGEMTALIFRPEVSTSTEINAIAGRGIGLDVVKNRVESVHGAVSVASTPGRGARFVLLVPLTLTRVRALLVRSGEERYAFVTSNVIRLLRVPPADLVMHQGRQTLPFEGAPLPIARLSRALGASSDGEPSNGRVPIVVVTAGATRAGLIVDELLSEQEIVVKSLGPRNIPRSLCAGATVLADGGLALILNASDVIRAALSTIEPQVPRSAEVKGVAAKKKRILLVEDSRTTRALEESILSTAGYEVVTATDGVEALQQLEAGDIDALISDVEMPRMDGIRLTETIRRVDRWRRLPVLLVTSLANEADRLRGLEAGANAYLVKSAFEQSELLETLASWM